MIERSEDLATILGELGVEVKRVTGDEIQGRCPLHVQFKGRESSRYSWYMNSDTGLFICHTCGSRGNLPMLVSAMTGDSDTILAVQGMLVRSGIERLTNPREAEPEVEVDWIRYSKFAPLPKAILEIRNLLPEYAHKYGVRWDKDERKTVTPIVSPMGELMGWQAKSLGVFLNVPEGVHKAKTLFGIERAVQRTAVLMESPLDVVRLSQFTTSISPLASFGANVSERQIKIISERFDRLIVAMDNDKAGILEARRLQKMWPSFREGIRYWSYSTTTAKDIGDMSDQEIERGLTSFKVTCP